MKHFVIWVLGVAVGVLLFFACVMGVSYSTIGEGALPAPEASFEEIVLTENGSCWHLPLIGGALDKELATAATLSVQKLGVITASHPGFTLPEWANYSVVVVHNAAGDVLFEGDVAQYMSEFYYPENGEYKVELYLWHLAKGATATSFEEGGFGKVYRNSGLETPAQPNGWYRYDFRFTLNATPKITLSSEYAKNGAVVALQIDGLLGGGLPVIETDLANVTAMPYNGGFRCYLPVTYNTVMGDHTIRVISGEQVFETTLKVQIRNFGTSNYQPEVQTPPTEADNAEYRNVIWQFYDAPATEKAWARSWTCPVSSYKILEDYGQELRENGTLEGYANCAILQTTNGQAVVSPAGGKVVYAGALALTGNTIVIDHGHGVHTYLFGLSKLDVAAGDVLLQNQEIGLAGETLTLDVKIANKSVYPWDLFRGQGGLFWQE